jgi:phosphotransferase system enzyme I (PtsP)
MPHLMLLHEIAEIIGASQTLQNVLDRVVELVARRMRSDVCSIWLLDAPRSQLTLAATQGLNRDAVGQSRLRQGEGVTWYVLERKGPLILEDASEDPHYVYLPETKEERFHSFLGLPLMLRGSPIGVLCIQGLEPRRFSADEVRALSAIASQIAPVVDNARLLSLLAGEEFDTARHAEEGPLHAVGTGCSAGVVSGRILRLGRPLPDNGETPAGTPDEEIQRLERACDRAQKDLLRMQSRLRERHAEEAALVFTAQLMFLEDPSFLDRLRASIKKGASASAAVRAVTKTVLSRFSQMEDIYLRERASDIQDLARRLLRNVHGKAEKRSRAEPLEGRIAVVPELTPSGLVSLAAEGITGVLCGGGGATSHAAVLARSLDLPLIVGLGDFVDEVPHGDEVLMDASSGEIVVRPPQNLIRESADRKDRVPELIEKMDAPTGPGRIVFEAEVNLWGDVMRAKEVGADGIGLYRTEFSYLMRPDLPGEQEQVVLYRRAVEEMAPQPVTFRLLDAGGDKLVPSLRQVAEPNPFLGYRSLRLLLDHPEILRPQIRAIVSALDGYEGRILVPMVGSVQDFRAVRAHLLDEEGRSAPPLGAMIELPSALMEIDALAREADFLSVGTNDLTQHLLGVDRTNARVTRFLDPCQPAVIGALHHICGAAMRAGRGVAMCGEMASDPFFLPLWVALGVERLSVHAKMIPLLRAVESRIDADESKEALQKILQMDARADIRAALARVTPKELEPLLANRGRR